MDKDTGAIGGLEHPPPTTRRMYYVSIVFDVAGLLICGLSGWRNVLVMMGYIAFSKSYSWHGIRLKKYPVLGWLSVLFFQGGYTFMQGNMASTDMAGWAWFTPQHLECMLFASLIIGGSYPLTQIYQHGEDGDRGDHTISYKLGIRGTFMFSSILFGMGAIVALHYFATYYSLNQFFIFLVCLVPVMIYFSSWMARSFKNSLQADYRHSMLMNKIAATCMIVCFAIITLLNQGVM